MYLWEPVEEGYYPDSVQPEMTVGAFYDMLRVEQTGEGWHAILFEAHVYDEWEWVDIDSLFDMVDEQVFDAKYAAVQWCEDQDSAKKPFFEEWGED